MKPEFGVPSCYQLLCDSAINLRSLIHMKMLSAKSDHFDIDSSTFSELQWLSITTQADLKTISGRD